MKEAVSKEKFKLLLTQEIKKNNPKANKPTVFYFYIRDFIKIGKNIAVDWHKELYPVILSDISKSVLENTAKDISESEYAFLYDKHIAAMSLLNDNETMRNQISVLTNVSIKGTEVEHELVITTQQDVNNANGVIARLSAQISKNIEILSSWFGYKVPEEMNLNHFENVKPDLTKVTRDELIAIEKKLFGGIRKD